MEKIHISSEILQSGRVKSLIENLPVRARVDAKNIVDCVCHLKQYEMYPALSAAGGEYGPESTYEMLAEHMQSLKDILLTSPWNTEASANAKINELKNLVEGRIRGHGDRIITSHVSKIKDGNMLGGDRNPGIC